MGGRGGGLQCEIESLQILDLQGLASLHILCFLLMQCCTPVVSGLRAAFNTAALIEEGGWGKEEGVSLSVCCPRLIIISFTYFLARNMQIYQHINNHGLIIVNISPISWHPRIHLHVPISIWLIFSRISLRDIL